MHIIKTLSDVRRLKLTGAISAELAEHFARKLHRSKEALEPELDIEEFSLEYHGSFGLLEKGDKNLAGIGLPESLAEVMPEWVSRLQVANEVYYVLYIMADNDYIGQVYLPDSILEGAIRLWISEQPAEEEEGEYGDEPEPVHPF